MLIDLANLADQHASGILVVLSHKCWDFNSMSPYPAVDMGSEDQNSGPDVCEARIFLNEHFYGPCFINIMYLILAHNI